MSDAEGSTTNKERRGCGTSSSRSLGHGKEKVCGCVGKTRPAASSRRPRSAGSAAELDFHQQCVYVRMSRSRKKTPVGSILVCGWTEKEDKKSWHRKLRARDLGGSATWCESTGRGMSKNFSATSLRRSPKTLATRGSCGRSGASGGRATVLTPNSNTCVGYANS